MHKRYSAFQYIFWIGGSMMIGAAFMWSVVSGLKIAYLEVFDKGRVYVFEHGNVDNKNIIFDSKEEKNVLIQSAENAGLSGRAELFSKKGKVGLSASVEKSLPKKPYVSTTAVSYLAADLDSGEVLLEKNKDYVLPIASVTKLVTAAVSSDIFLKDKILTVTKKAVDTYGTSGGLKVGEKITVKDMLYPLLLESSNDAAEVLAQAENREQFMKLMNSKAEKMGAVNTFFDDPSGLSAKNVSTASDLFKIASYIYKNKNDIFDITAKKTHSIKDHNWTNPTYLRNLSSYIGGKNGYTDEALRTAVSLFNIKDKNGVNRNVAVIILKSSDRNKDVASIVNYLAANIEFPDVKLPSTAEKFMMEFF